MNSTDKELRERFDKWWGTQPELHTPILYSTARTSYLAAHAEAQAEIESLRKDAERYRWLRERAWFVDRAAYIYFGKMPWDGNPTLEADDVEEAIDAAMASEVKINA